MEINKIDVKKEPPGVRESVQYSVLDKHTECCHNSTSSFLYKQDMGLPEKKGTNTFLPLRFAGYFRPLGIS